MFTTYYLFRVRNMVLVLAAMTVSLARPHSAVAELMPITLAGYNRDVVTDADPAVRFATTFDGPPGLAAWFQAGTEGHSDGLPTGGTFTSATGSGAVFQLQPANGNNILRVGGNAPLVGTLSLVTPGAFSSLAILAASGGSFSLSTGTVTLNFDDSTTASFSYNAFDWNQLTPGAAPFVALGGLARNGSVGSSGTSFFYDNIVPFALYETVINLAPVGLDGKTINSLTFTQAIGANGTGIFGVSGVPSVSSAVPEPATLVLFSIGILGLLGYVWRCRPRSMHA